MNDDAGDDRAGERVGLAVAGELRKKVMVDFAFLQHSKKKAIQVMIQWSRVGLRYLFTPFFTSHTSLLH